MHKTAEEQFLDDMDSIAADIVAMYNEVDEYFLYWPSLYIAFADIDFDGTPEFFYGYQAITASQGNIWYRAYSLTNRAMIDFEHVNSFNTYIRDDTDCAFFTGQENFIEGYYLSENAEPCFVTKATVGTVMHIRTDYIFMEYKDGGLSVSTGFECAEELQAIKQAWSLTTVETIEEDMLALWNTYLEMDEQGSEPDLSSQATPLTAGELFEQLTNRPLPEWTIADFEELLSMSNDDLHIDLKEHYGGRNFIFGIIGASVHFPNEASNLSEFDCARGYLKYVTEYADDGELLYPSLLTLGYAPKDKLLGADLGGTLGDIMDVFGEADIEYVVRVNGGVKAQVYFIRYNINGLVFLFECALNGELTELPPHPPLPTREEIVSSKIDNVHIVKEDSVLLEQLGATDIS
jgi:hypothetical protein